MPKTTGLIESNKRNRVSRKNIHSSLASSSELANPHEAKLVYSTLETAYSGYVHGAYGHLMEMYGGPKFGFRANGLPNEAFRNSIERQFGDLVYIGLIILEMLSKTLDDGDTNKSLLAYRKTLEGKYPEFALRVESRLKQAKLPIKNMK